MTSKAGVPLLSALLLPVAAAAVAGEPIHHDAGAIRRAHEAIEKEVPVAQVDPTRSVYHFVPEARWMNDPNGCFFADGWFHVFYQLNPYGNEWGYMHWGHDRGRHIVYAWIHPTRQAKWWANCFALPRVLTLGDDGRPVQQPVPELAKLRGEHVAVMGLTGSQVLAIEGDTLEILAAFEHLDKGPAGLRVRRSDDGSRALEIRCHGGGVNVFGTHLPAKPAGESKAITVHLFLDKSIIEVFVNGGKDTFAGVIYPPAEDLGVEVFSGGTASIDVWRMKGIW